MVMKKKKSKGRRRGRWGPSWVEEVNAKRKNSGEFVRRGEVLWETVTGCKTQSNCVAAKGKVF